MSERGRVEKIIENRHPLTNLASIDPVFQSLTLGESGLAGQLDVFPSTAARGRLRLTCADQTGDTIVTVTTAAFAAARTVTIPDPGANASFVLTQGAKTMTGVTTFASDVKSHARMYLNQGTPETITGTASLTDAQMLSTILVATPSATATYTVRTGTQLETALGGTMANGESFDLTIINLGGAGDIITMAVATGITFVGSLTIDDAGADINSSGTFRFRRTAANTFVAYRIA